MQLDCRPQRLIWLPIVAGVLVLAARRPRALALGALGRARWRGCDARLLARSAVGHFDTADPRLQFVEKRSWIERFNILYHLGVDGISLLLSC